MQPTVNRNRAETLALEVLAFLAENPERLERFLRQSGLDGAVLKARAGESETLLAVLDFLLADETLAKDFCLESGRTAREVLTAQHVLAG